MTKSLCGDTTRETDSWPKVAIIVLNWNNYEDTAECLESLDNINYPNYDVIVVDNNSADDSGERLKNDFEWCEFVFNETNRGFAGGCNSGIRVAQKNDVEYILLLNNDTNPNTNFLRRMASTGEANPGTGIIGSLLLEYQRDVVADAGRKLDFHTLSFDNPHKGQPGSSLTGTHEVEAISGGCMMIKTALMQDIGLLDDDRFFFGGEDVDYCLRAKKAGWRIMIQLDAPVRHKVNSTATSGSEFIKYHRERNKLWIGYMYGGLTGKFGMVRRSIKNSRRILALFLNKDKSRGISILRSYVDFVSGVLSRGRKSQTQMIEKLDSRD